MNVCLFFFLEFLPNKRHRRPAILQSSSCDFRPSLFSSFTRTRTHIQCKYMFMSKWTRTRGATCAASTLPYIYTPFRSFCCCRCCWGPMYRLSRVYTSLSACMYPLAITFRPISPACTLSLFFSYGTPRARFNSTLSRHRVERKIEFALREFFGCSVPNGLCTRAPSRVNYFSPSLHPPRAFNLSFSSATALKRKYEQPWTNGELRNGPKTEFIHCTPFRTPLFIHTRCRCLHVRVNSHVIWEIYLEGRLYMWSSWMDVPRPRAAPAPTIIIKLFRRQLELLNWVSTETAVNNYRATKQPYTRASSTLPTLPHSLLH